MLDFLGNPEFWKYASIPTLAAFIGWFTNWIAIKLSFYPLHFVGIPPYLGWQGIIPRKAAKMARISVEASLAKIGTPREVYQQMDPATLSRHINQILSLWIKPYTKDILFEQYPQLWKLLPAKIKERIYDEVAAKLPAVVDDLVYDLGENIDEILDLEHLAVEELTNNRKLLVRIFQECGEREFRFIINSGIYFGALFGFIQMLVWMQAQLGWILPSFGVLVGLATNWIALQIIFRPVEPIRLGPLVLQGLFLKRQREVARVWCKIVTEEILTLEKISDNMLNGPHSERTRELISGHVEGVIDKALSNNRAAIELIVGPNKLGRVRSSISNKAIAVFGMPFNDAAFAEDRRQVVENMLFEKMVAMSPEEFQDLLRPAFQEDEAKLIAVGGALGAMAGFIQLGLFLI